MPESSKRNQEDDDWEEDNPPVAVSCVVHCLIPLYCFFVFLVIKPYLVNRKTSGAILRLEILLFH